MIQQARDINTELGLICFAEGVTEDDKVFQGRLAKRHWSRFIPRLVKSCNALLYKPSLVVELAKQASCTL